MTVGNLDEAIQILAGKQGTGQRSIRGWFASYSEQLISIYEKQADTKAYKEELLYYVLKCPQHEVDIYSEIEKRSVQIKSGSSTGSRSCGSQGTLQSAIRLWRAEGM